MNDCKSLKIMFLDIKVNMVINLSDPFICVSVCAFYFRIEPDRFSFVSLSTVKFTEIIHHEPNHAYKFDFSFVIRNMLI